MNRARVIRATRTRSFVACDVGEATYVLPVEEVQEIVQPLRLTALPHAPHGVIGAVEHRNEVVPILDLSERLGYGPTRSDKVKWVLLRGPRGAIGVVVARVLEVFEISESSIRPAPDVGNVAARAARSVLNHRGKMAFVLNLNAVAELAEVNLPESVEE